MAARWNEAVTEAGFEPNQLKRRANDDDALNKLAEETRRLGHFPTSAELRLRRRTDEEFPGSGILKRLGPKPVLAERLVKYCEEHPEFADVMQIVAPVIAEGEAEGVTPVRSSSAESRGFVYLLKSGQYYKIGHTNSVGRRAYELAIQLPEPAMAVHEIATDDPKGIEAYWHRRFAARRRDGEWFELSRSDVDAFRRRKFM